MIVRGLLFDLDDTLYPRELYLDSGFDAVATQVAESWRLSRETVLASLRRAHIGPARGHEFQALCTELRLPLSVVPMLVQSFRMHCPSITLLPAVRAVLQQLRRDGWRLGVLTNGDPGVQRRKVEALGLHALVDSVTYAEEHSPRGKPDPMVFVTAARRLCVPRTQCVHVGDDPRCDILGAHAAGLRAIRVLSPPAWNDEGRPDDREWQQSEADATVDTVLEIGAVASLVVQESTRGV